MKQTTIKISELIAALEELKDEEGDLPVAMAQDEEGNSFGTLSSTNFIENCVGIDNGIIVLYPAVDHLDLDDISSEEEILSDTLLTPKRTSRVSYIDDDEEDTEDEDDEEDPPYGCVFGSDDE